MCFGFVSEKLSQMILKFTLRLNSENYVRPFTLNSTNEKDC